MPRFYLRSIADQSGSDEIISAIHGMNCVERVEEVAGLMSGMQDDSSSAALVDDVGPGVHTIEIEVGHGEQIDRVRRVAEETADKIGASLEFLQEL